MLYSSIIGSFSVTQTSTQLPNSISEIFHNVVNSRSSEIRRQIIEDASTFSPFYLKDIDWTVKLVLASDCASVLRQPLLMVTLYLASRTGVSKTVKLELNQTELDSLIESLTQATGVMNSLRV